MYRYTGIVDLRADLKNGKVSCEALVAETLARIEANRQLNIYLEVFQEEALERARTIDHKIKNGQAGKLAGVIIAIKDNICYKDHRVSAASQIGRAHV